MVELTHQTDAMVEALFAAAKNMPSLKKDDKNAHGGYSYVSIDLFYEKAATVVRDAGLLWIPREVHREVRTELRYGSVATTYSANLICLANGQVWENFFTATVQHPLSGAQDAGSSLSYFEKLFLRHVFKVVTGEPDADATDNTPSEPTRTRTPVWAQAQAQAQALNTYFPMESPKGEVSDSLRASVAQLNAGQEEVDLSWFTQATETFLPLALSEESLEKYWADNQANLETLKGVDTEGYKGIVAAFKKRRLEIRKGK